MYLDTKNRDSYLKSIGYYSYQRYIKSTLWKKVRKKVLSVNRYKCCVCTEGRGTRVQHVFYTPENLSGTSTEGFRVFCKWHHQRLVEMRIANRKLSVEDCVNEFLQNPEKYRNQFPGNPHIGAMHRHQRNGDLKSVEEAARAAKNWWLSSIYAKHRKAEFKQFGCESLEEYLQSDAYKNLVRKALSRSRKCLLCSNRSTDVLLLSTAMEVFTRRANALIVALCQRCHSDITLETGSPLPKDDSVNELYRRAKELGQEDWAAAVAKAHKKVKENKRKKFEEIELNHEKEVSKDPSILSKRCTVCRINHPKQGLGKCTPCLKATEGVSKKTTN